MEQPNIRAQYEAALKHAHSLKTNKARVKAFSKAREIKWRIVGMLRAELAEENNPETIVATVLHARPTDEHLLVDTKFGKMWVSPTGDELAKSWYAHTCCIEYTKGQTIEIDVTFEVNTERLFIQVVPGKMRGGTVNETQYAELCKRDNLAFFKYPNSTGVTGLFAQPKGGV